MAQEYLCLAQDAYTEASDLKRQGMAAQNLAEAFTEAGEFGLAEAAVEVSLRSSAALGADEEYCHSEARRARILFLKGRPKEALTIMTDLYDIKKNGLRIFDGGLGLYLSDMYVTTGKLGKVGTIIDEVAAFAAQRRWHSVEAMARLQRGRIEMARVVRTQDERDYEGAKDLLRSAEAVFRQGHNSMQLSRVLVAKARLEQARFPAHDVDRMALVTSGIGASDEALGLAESLELMLVLVDCLTSRARLFLLRHRLSSSASGSTLHLEKARRDLVRARTYATTSGYAWGLLSVLEGEAEIQGQELLGLEAPQEAAEYQALRNKLFGDTDNSDD